MESIFRRENVQIFLKTLIPLSYLLCSSFPACAEA